MKKIMTDKDRDTIIMLLSKGVKGSEIANILGCSESAVAYVRRFEELAKTRDMETLNHFRQNREPLYQWVIKKYGIVDKGNEKPKDKPKSELSKTDELEKHNEKVVGDLLVEFISTIKETNEILKKLL